MTTRTIPKKTVGVRRKKSVRPNRSHGKKMDKNATHRYATYSQSGPISTQGGKGGSNLRRGTSNLGHGDFLAIILGTRAIALFIICQPVSDKKGDFPTKYLLLSPIRQDLSTTTIVLLGLDIGRSRSMARMRFVHLRMMIAAMPK